MRAASQAILTNLIRNLCLGITFKITTTPPRGQWVNKITTIQYMDELLHYTETYQI